MEIIFNKDGSIKEKNIDRHINQNSSNIVINFSVDGLSKSEYSANCYFQLPTEMVITELCQETENGYKVTLTNAETKWDGVLAVSFEISGDEVNFTTPVNFVINKTVNVIASDYNTLSTRISSNATAIATLQGAIGGNKLYRHKLTFNVTGGSFVIADFYSNSVAPLTTISALVDLGVVDIKCIKATPDSTEIATPYFISCFSDSEGGYIISSYGLESLKIFLITDVVKEIL